MTLKPAVLFVCVHNAGRSQMAAAFLKKAAADRVEVLSAGTEPADSVSPVTVEAMSEVGIDLSYEKPKELRIGAVRLADVVVTMGCGDSCPVFPGKRYEDWEIKDPSGRPLEEVRLIRDEVRNRVEVLLASLMSSQTQTAP